MKTIVYNNATNQQNEATHNTHKHLNTKFKRIFMKNDAAKANETENEAQNGDSKRGNCIHFTEIFRTHTHAHIDSSKSKMHYITSK